MGNYYEIDYDFGKCSEETLAVVRELLKEGHYVLWSLPLEEDKTVLAARVMRKKTWEEDERFMRLVLRILLPGETVLIQATDEYGTYGSDDAGLPTPWVGTLADYVKRFFETDE